MREFATKDKNAEKQNSESEKAATPKPEIKEESKSSISGAANSNENKTTEPVTSAVAPMQKTSPDKSLSPVEGKENIPISNANDPTEAKNSDNDLAEVPYKPKSPEIIDLESDTYKTITSNNALSNSILHEVKKRKLDILKEGGLEVTPVRSTLPSTDIRPTVIQPNLPAVQIGSITVTADKRSMPPPSINATLIKRSSTTPHLLPPNSAPSLTKPKPPSGTSYTYMNGTCPPKVLQSKSIYSPSEKTVYGDPKVCFVPPMHPVHAPKFVGNGSKQNGADILDLTVKRPQKPIVAIMQVPSMQMSNIPWNRTKENHKKPQIPLIDGRRVGSNLEITLVGPGNDRNHTNTHHSSKNISAPQHNNYLNHKSPKKRSSVDSYMAHNKIPRVEDNYPSRHMMPHYGYSPREKSANNVEINIPNPYLNRNHTKIENNMQPNNKPVQNTSLSNKHYPSVFPNYLSQLSTAANKGMQPYMPIMDPMYYSALQSLYSPNPLSTVSQFFPTPEQLQFYNDLIAHNSRVRLPLPFSQDGNSSISSADMDNLKKQ